ncbi:MAG TPA: tRNA uracil 4-sulfurtransferase ThiI [Candidatus Acidoferrum sp.]|jgi:thiamine biosynthesis protein ThiI|nr:tRNA uracil 4-sulfurtransferase ThiI [Candidatus Acidoferrum sp.]
MKNPVIVVHYHELWLKGGNRRFFLGKLFTALRLALEGIPVERIEQPGDRFLVRLGDGASLEAAAQRIERVLGVAYYAVARPVERDMDALCQTAWQELGPLEFGSFAVRARRSDKTFPHSSMEIDRVVGRFLQDRLREQGRSPRVQLKDPDVTCFVEVTPGPLLVYAKKLPGAGGLPPNTAGRIACLLSGGYDSAVAAYHMMKRGAHLGFIHFYGAGARPGESSLHVASGLARQLVRYQFHANLYRVPFEAIQREIVRYAPEDYRVLIYRRMMLRIAEVLARRDHALALVTGDSLGQVASQTLRNLVAVDAAARLPVFRPLIGTDKIDILATAKKIGTYDISSEPFHDCCPVFLPKSPALSASPQDLDAAEGHLDLRALVTMGLQGTTLERLHYSKGVVETVEARPIARAGKKSTAIA